MIILIYNSDECQIIKDGHEIMIYSAGNEFINVTAKKDLGVEVPAGI